MRKFALRAVALATAVTLSAGLFGGCSSEEENKEFKAKLDTDKKVSLESAGSVGNFEALDAVVNNFNEIYPNVTVSYEQYSSGQLKETWITTNTLIS